MPLYRNRRSRALMGQDMVVVGIDPITGESLLDYPNADSGGAFYDTGAYMPDAPEWPYSSLSQENIKHYFEVLVWPAAKRAATQGEIDDLMIEAYDVVNSASLEALDSAMSSLLADMIDQYSQRAYTYLETGADPWALSTKVPGGKIGLAAGVVAAAVGIHRILAGEWIWNILR